MRPLELASAGSVMCSAIGRMKERSFAGTVAVDQVRLIGREPGVGLIGSVDGMEVIRGVVDVDGNARKLGQPLFVGKRRCQKRRGCEGRYESPLYGRRDQGVRGQRVSEFERERWPGAPCARVASAASTTVRTRGTKGSGESINVRASAATGRGAAVVLEAGGSMVSPDWDTPSQVAKCRAPAAVMQSTQQKRSPTGCQPTRGSELSRR